MSNEELKQALTEQCPVTAYIPLMGRIEYAYVSAIVYRRSESGGIKVRAQLMDKNLMSVSEIAAEDISRA